MDGFLGQAMQFAKVNLLLPYFLWRCYMAVSFSVFESVNIFYSLIHRTKGTFKDLSGRAMQSDKPAVFFGVLVAVLCLLGFSGNAFIREGRTLDSVALAKEKTLPRRSSNSINYHRIRYPAHILRGKYKNKMLMIVLDQVTCPLSFSLWPSP